MSTPAFGIFHDSYWHFKCWLSRPIKLPVGCNWFLIQEKFSCKYCNFFIDEKYSLPIKHYFLIPDSTVLSLLAQYLKCSGSISSPGPDLLVSRVSGPSGSYVFSKWPSKTLRRVFINDVTQFWCPLSCILQVPLLSHVILNVSY